MVLELLGEQGAVGPPQPWRMAGAAGGPLPPAATLDELGVLDGELLRIGPDAVPPAPPVFDDPVDALAATAGARVTDGRFATGVLAFVVLAASGLLAGFPTAGPAPGWPGVARGRRGRVRRCHRDPARRSPGRRPRTACRH